RSGERRRGDGCSRVASSTEAARSRRGCHGCWTSHRCSAIGALIDAGRHADERDVIGVERHRGHAPERLARTVTPAWRARWPARRRAPDPAAATEPTYMFIVTTDTLP